MHTRMRRSDAAAYILRIEFTPYPFFNVQEAFTKGVRINCICPSCVDTDMLRQVTRNPVMKQAVDEMGVQR